MILSQNQTQSVGHLARTIFQLFSPLFCFPPLFFRLRLLIDDQPLKNNQKLRDFSDSQQSLRLGGSQFEGCISNVFVRRWVPFLCACAADENGLPSQGGDLHHMLQEALISQSFKTPSLARYTH